MEKKVTCQDEVLAKDVVWYLMSIDEKATVDGVIPPDPEGLGGWEICFRCWDDDVFDDVMEMIKDYDYNVGLEPDSRETVRRLNLNDAEIFQTLARYSYLKNYVLDDDLAMEMLRDAVIELVKSTTATRPGPSVKVYNLAMSYLDVNERIGEYNEGD